MPHPGSASAADSTTPRSTHLPHRGDSAIIDSGNAGVADEFDDPCGLARSHREGADS
ncbi:hypothetical protein GFS60_07223 (plasmid) [Rhodococcus sp. WAY2]|nr:hypothetical protein GFS60_07223 [Rhodococcus sp. WAY2]